MYAILEAGGRQWRVESGTRLSVNRLATPVGQEHVVDRVLFAHDGAQAHVGRPYVAGAAVVCEVLEHHLGPREISYHFRRRENWRKTVGHRQPLTRLVVRTITVNASSAPAKEAHVPAAKEAAATKRAPRTSALKPQLKSLAKKPVTRSRAARPDIQHGT